MKTGTSIRTAMLILAISATATLAGCSDTSGTFDRGLRYGGAVARTQEQLTPDQEYYLGRAVAAGILSEYDVYENEAATRYVNQVGAAIASASDMPYVYGGYRFIILDSDSINAFAVPGAYIFVTRGMLRCTESEDELAAVLAHEVAHIQREHAMEVIRGSRWGDVMGMAAEEGIDHAVGDSEVDLLADALSDMTGDVLRQLTVGGYSRSAERDADRDAVVLLQRVGYDPNAVVTMLERMATRIEPDGHGFAATHPSPQQRIDWVQSRIGATASTAAPAPRQQRFEQAMAEPGVQ